MIRIKKNITNDPFFFLKKNNPHIAQAFTQQALKPQKREG